MSPDLQGTPPAQLTPVATQGTSLQPNYLTCMEGLATNYGNAQRSTNQAKALNNFQMLTQGIWQNHGLGWTRQRATQFNSGNQFYEFAFIVDNLGVQTPVFQNGGTLYKYNLSTNTETSIMTGLDNTGNVYPTMRRIYSPVSQYGGLLYCSGTTQPQKIIGPSYAANVAALFKTTALPSGTWPGLFNSKTYSMPKFCEPFGTRMVYGGFTGTNTSFDILISSFNDPELFTVQGGSPNATDAVAFTYPAELGTITGIKAFRVNNQTLTQVLIVGCTNGIFVISGGDATSYSLNILTQEIGVASNRCWVTIGNDMLYLSTSGIRTISALANNATLLLDTKTQDIQDLINQIDPAYFYRAHAVHHQSTYEVQFWVPLLGDNGVCQHAFIANYNNPQSGNGTIVPAWSTRDGTSVACSINFQGVMYGGGYGAGTSLPLDGLLQVHYSGNNYDTVPMKGFIALSLVSIGNPSQKASMRVVTVLCDGNQQQFHITAYVTSRQSNKDMLRRTCNPGATAMGLPVTPGTALGAWTLGLGAFAASYLKTLDFKPIGNGTFWDFEINTNNNGDTLDFVGLAYTLSGGSYQR